MSNYSEKYGIRVLEDQFGTPVHPYFWDTSEELAIKHFEQVALSLKGVGRAQYSMIELGSNQAYYSLLFKGILGKDLTKNILVEPCDKHLLRGLKHFELNGFEGVWVNEGIGSTWVLHQNESFAKPTTTVQDLMMRNSLPFLDVLHCDIDGSEVLALESSKEAFAAHRVMWVFLLTHSAELHARCRELMIGWGYATVEDHPTMDVGYDGLLVFRSAQL